MGGGWGLGLEAGEGHSDGEGCSQSPLGPDWPKARAFSTTGSYMCQVRVFMNTESPGSHLLLGLKHKVSLCSGYTWGLHAGCRYLGEGARVVP